MSHAPRLAVLSLVIVLPAVLARLTYQEAVEFLKSTDMEYMEHHPGFEALFGDGDDDTKRFNDVSWESFAAWVKSLLDARASPQEFAHKQMVICDDLVDKRIAAYAKARADRNEAVKKMFEERMPTGSPRDTTISNAWRRRMENFSAPAGKKDPFGASCGVHAALVLVSVGCGGHVIVSHVLGGRAGLASLLKVKRARDAVTKVRWLNATTFIASNRKDGAAAAAAASEVLASLLRWTVVFARALTCTVAAAGVAPHLQDCADGAA